MDFFKRIAEMFLILNCFPIYLAFAEVSITYAFNTHNVQPAHNLLVSYSLAVIKCLNIIQSIGNSELLKVTIPSFCSFSLEKRA